MICYIYIYVYQPNDFMIYHISTTEIYDCMYIYIYTYNHIHICLFLSHGTTFQKVQLKLRNTVFTH